MNSARPLTRRLQVLILAVLSVACPAQPPGVTGDQPWKVSANAGTRYSIGGDAEGDGTLDALISEAVVALDGPLWRGSSARFAVNWEGRHYDPEGGFTLYPGQGLSIEDVHTVGASARVLQVLGPRWAALVRASVKGSAEVGAPLEDGLSWNVLAGAGYQVSDGFRAGFGVLVAGRLEESLLVVPAIQFDWRIDEQWRLRLEGPALELTWRPADDWLLGLGARWDSVRARLADRAPTNDGIFEDARIPLTLRVRHDVTDWAWVQLSAGTDLYRKVEVEDRDGDRLASSDMDPGFFFGLSAGVTF